MADEILNTPTALTGLTLNKPPEPAKPAPVWMANETLAAQIAQKIKANSLNGETDDLTSFETKKKVDNVKQKVYVFGLVIISIFVYQYANTSFQTFNQTQETVSAIQGEVNVLETSIEQFKSNADTLKQVTNDSDINNLISCINNINLCDKIYQKIPKLKSNLPVIRSYLLLTPLSGQKMEIDQKSILKYYNEYLLRDKDGYSIGQLLNISFSNPWVFDQARGIYSIDVDTTITFPSKAAMMSLIEKVESWLDQEFRLLLKIKSVNYDIVKFEEPQTVNMSFTIYHYKN